MEDGDNRDGVLVVEVRMTAGTLTSVSVGSTELLPTDQTISSINGNSATYQGSGLST
jgi:hypothetical protein